ILKSYSLPGSSGPALFRGPLDGRKLPGPSSRRLRSSISVLWQSPSMFSPNSTNAPNVAIRETLPRTMSPTLCCLNQSPQMSFTCFMPSDTRRFSGSIRNTFAVIGSPFLNTSCGFFTRPVQLTSPTCTNPSKPSSISMNAPNSAMLRTLPVTIVPTGYFSAPAARIGLRLLDAQRNATVAWLDVQHHHVHFVADLRQLRGVRGLLGPGHFRNVHQAFDALFQLHEHAVVHHADDL